MFELNTDGTGFTNLYSFTASAAAYLNVTNDDGALPVAGLILSGSTLYGTALKGGSSGNGTVFAVTTNGSSFTTLHSFAGFPSDGAYSMAGLILSGKTVYGTAESGGSFDYGTVFSLPLVSTSLPQLAIISSGTNIILMGL